MYTCTVKLTIQRPTMSMSPISIYSVGPFCYLYKKLSECMYNMMKGTVPIIDHCHTRNLYPTTQVVFIIIYIHTFKWRIRDLTGRGPGDSPSIIITHIFYINCLKCRVMDSVRACACVCVCVCGASGRGFPNEWGQGSLISVTDSITFATYNIAVCVYVEGGGDCPLDSVYILYSSHVHCHVTCYAFALA